LTDFKLILTFTVSHFQGSAPEATGPGREPQHPIPQQYSPPRSYIIPSVFSGSAQGLFPVECAQKNSKGRQPVGILIECLNNLYCLLLISGYTLSSLKKFELLTLSLRLSPATLQRKLISAA